jgi:glycosyltransferase involved in cell wall biosynthesis
VTRAPDGHRAAAVIPARNEAHTIGAVIYAALDAQLTAEVVVADNGSTDATAQVAAAHGARVVPAPDLGKGQAMRAGVKATEADVIVFLDADLVGLRPQHVDRLIRPVLADEVAMACGLFDRGPVQNPLFLATLPVLTGQRAVRRDLFEKLTGQDIRGYRVEAALNSLVARRGERRRDEVLPGLWHRTKEEKLATPLAGRASKMAMLATACWSYLRFTATRPGSRPAVRAGRLTRRPEPSRRQPVGSVQ